MGNLFIETLMVITLSFVVMSQAFLLLNMEEPQPLQPLYERVIQRFAETHEYNKTTYNCVNYSKDLAFILDNLGYETSQERHIKMENGTHSRLNLNLEIEPQTAEVIVNRK